MENNDLKFELENMEKIYKEHSKLIDKYMAILVDAEWDSMWLYHMQKNFKEFTGRFLNIPDSDMNILIKFFGMPSFKNTHEYNNMYKVDDPFSSFIVNLRHGTYLYHEIKWYIEMEKENRLDDDETFRRDYDALMEEYDKYYFCRIIVNAIRNEVYEINESSRHTQNNRKLAEI